jgi:hypothetical protein
MYAPTKEQEEADRLKAYESGVPHGAAPRRCKRKSRLVASRRAQTLKLARFPARLRGAG